MGWGAGPGAVQHGAVLAVLECLLDDPLHDSSSLAAATDLDERVVAASIAELTSLGVVRGPRDDASGWALVHPQSALSGILADRERRAARHLDELADARRLAHGLLEAFAGAGRHVGGPEIVTLHGRDEVMERLAVLEGEVEDEVCSFLTQLPPPEIVAEGRRLDDRLLARGVTLRVLCLEAFYRDATVARHLHSSVDLGVRVRTRATLPSRMLIFDRTTAVLPTDPEDSAEGALVIEHRGIVTLLHSLFELHWRDSDPLTTTAPAPALAGPRPMELAVLNLLALGHKDEAIARSTGQSARTIRRVVAGLAVTLNARSRFDLALRAAARGWIDSPFD